MMVADEIITSDLYPCVKEEGGNVDIEEPKPIPGFEKSGVAPLTQNPRTPIVVGEDFMFLCDIPGCGKRFMRPANLEAHRLLHKGARPYKCSVEGCAAAYTMNQHLVRHFNVSHKKAVGAFECKEDGCVATFDTNLSLMQHFRRVHNKLKTSESGFKCQLCQKGFPSKTKLHQHKSVDFMCQVSGRRFLLESKLKIHEPRHETKRTKPTECSLCELKLDNWEQLVQHRSTEEHLVKQTIAWTCCGKTFSDQSNFNQHSKTHENERDVFRCTYVEGCNRFYYFLKNLRQHIRVAHQRDTHKPPKCSICDREFCSKQRLDTHMTTIHAPGRVSRQSRQNTISAPETRDDIIRKLSGKQKLSGRELLWVKKPPGGKGKERSGSFKIDISDLKTRVGEDDTEATHGSSAIP